MFRQIDKIVVVKFTAYILLAVHRVFYGADNRNKINFIHDTSKPPL